MKKNRNHRQRRREYNLCTTTNIRLKLWTLINDRPTAYCWRIKSKHKPKTLKINNNRTREQIIGWRGSYHEYITQQWCHSSQGFILEIQQSLDYQS